MDQNMRQQHMFRREYFGKSLAVLCGMFLIVLTIAIGAFLLAKGMLTFTQFHHSIGEFLFSSAWKPSDTEMGGGQVGAAIYIWGSILTCTLALVISVPFSLATAVFMTQIAPKLGERMVAAFAASTASVWPSAGITAVSTFEQPASVQARVRKPVSVQVAAFVTVHAPKS